MMKARQPRRFARRAFNRCALVLAIVIGAAMPGTRSAQAHPHVWVVSASELIFNADGALTGIRQRWTFDDMFSAYALQGLATRTKGVYTRDDLAPLAHTNVESLKEYGYFTFAKSDGRKQKLLDPVDYFLEYRNSTLVLHFTLPLQAPLRAKAFQIEIFDPSHFVDFAFENATPVTLAGAPAGCNLDITRPTDGTAKAQSIDEDSFLNGANKNFGAMFANRIAVKCP